MQAYRLIRDPNGDMVFSKTSPQSIGPGGGSMMRNDVSKDTIEFHQNEIDRLRKVKIALILILYIVYRALQVIVHYMCLLLLLIIIIIIIIGNSNNRLQQQ